MGKTSQKLEYRFKQHLRCTYDTYSSRWIKTLLADGLKPAVVVIETVTDWAEAEEFWIAYFRAIGANLTNIERGGSWHPGYVRQRESVERGKATVRQRGPSQAQKENIERLRRRLSEDPEFYAEWKARQQAAIKTPEYRAKMAAVVSGRKMPKDAIERTRAAHIGRRNSPEQLARISAGAREREARKKARRLAASGQACLIP